VPPFHGHNTLGWNFCTLLCSMQIPHCISPPRCLSIDNEHFMANCLGHALSMGRWKRQLLSHPWRC
jgi:hypothetical protein